MYLKVICYFWARVVCVFVLSYNDYWFSLFRLAMLLEIGHMWWAIVCVFLVDVILWWIYLWSL